MSSHFVPYCFHTSGFCCFQISPSVHKRSCPASHFPFACKVVGKLHTPRKQRTCYQFGNLFSFITTHYFKCMSTRFRTLSNSFSQTHSCSCNISKMSARVSSVVSNNEKQMKALGLRPRAFIVSRCLEPWWNPKHEFLRWLLKRNNKKICSDTFFCYCPPQMKEK